MKIPDVLWSYMIGPAMMTPLAHFLGMVRFQVYGGVSAILGNGYGIRGREGYCKYGPTAGILCWVYDVLD